MGPLSRFLPALALALALVAGCARTGATGAPGQASAPRLLGLDVGWVVSNSGQILMTPQVAQQVGATGANLARVEFRTTPFLSATTCVFTAAICKQRQQLAWQQAYQAYDEVFANLAAAHVQVLGLLDYTTVSGTQAQWTADNAEHNLGTGANPFTAAFAQTAEQIMAHYEGKIHLWEIWNEPNAWTQSGPNGTYSGGTFMYPSNYAALLEATYQDAVVQHHLPVTLISGGVFGHSIGNVYSAQNAGAQYLDDVFAYWKQDGVKRYPLDAVGEHLYISQGGPVTTGQIQEYLNWVHTVAQSYTGQDIPTYVTEIGWTRNAVGAQQQAQNLQVALAAAQAEPYVRGLVVFNFKGMGYGVYSSAGTPEPSLPIFQTVAKSWEAP